MKQNDEEREYYSLENVPCESGCVKMEEGEEELFEEPRRDLKTPQDFYDGMQRSLKMVEVLNRAIGVMGGVSGFGNARLITVFTTTDYKGEKVEVSYSARLTTPEQITFSVHVEGEDHSSCADLKGNLEEQLRTASEMFSTIVNDERYQITEISLLGD